jgi:hypothetical protein
VLNRLPDGISKSSKLSLQSVKCFLILRLLLSNGSFWCERFGQGRRGLTTNTSTILLTLAKTPSTMGKFLTAVSASSSASFSPFFAALILSFFVPPKADVIFMMLISIEASRAGVARGSVVEVCGFRMDWTV